MSEAPNFQAEVRQLLRARVLDAAYALVCAEGWQAVNMSSIAATVGISRQVLYKEIGAKQALGQALVQGRPTDSSPGSFRRCMAIPTTWPPVLRLAQPLPCAPAPTTPWSKRALPVLATRRSA